MFMQHDSLIYKNKFAGRYFLYPDFAVFHILTGFITEKYYLTGLNRTFSADSSSDSTTDEINTHS